MNRITKKFAELKKINKTAFIGYVTGGDPTIEKTVELDPYKAYLNHKLYIDAIKARDSSSVAKKIREALAEWVDYVNK